MLDDYYGNVTEKDDIDFIIKVTEAIESNLETENFTAETLSQELAVSYMHLYRRIKELCDMTPSAFIQKIRLKKAAMMLKNRKLSVQEVIYACGFNNRSYFYREFQKEYGVSPKNYASNEDKQP